MGFVSARNQRCTDMRGPVYLLKMNHQRYLLQFAVVLYLFCAAYIAQDSLSMLNKFISAKFIKNDSSISFL